MSRAGGQAGYTLVEVVITVAIGAVVMGALTSVILTSVRAADTASSRVEASAEIRNFEFFAYDDFAASKVQAGISCTQQSPCTTQPLVLSGTRVSNTNPPVSGPIDVTYTWDGSSSLDRESSGSGGGIHIATDVSAFAWYIDTSGTFPTVVIQLTITVRSYSESQNFLFYPRLNP
jgi:prepilin-type N-terminal cleavage/methylation domain-containing protein